MRDLSSSTVALFRQQRAFTEQAKNPQILIRISFFRQIFKKETRLQIIQRESKDSQMLHQVALAALGYTARFPRIFYIPSVEQTMRLRHSMKSLRGTPSSSSMSILYIEIVRESDEHHAILPVVVSYSALQNLWISYINFNAFMAVVAFEKLDEYWNNKIQKQRVKVHHWDRRNLHLQRLSLRHGGTNISCLLKAYQSQWRACTQRLSIFDALPNHQPPPDCLDHETSYQTGPPPDWYSCCFRKPL